MTHPRHCRGLRFTVAIGLLVSGGQSNINVSNAIRPSRRANGAPKSDHTRLAHLCVTLSNAKGLNRQILRSAQNDSAARLHRKVYECSAPWFRGFAPSAVTIPHSTPTFIGLRRENVYNVAGRCAPRRVFGSGLSKPRVRIFLRKFLRSNVRCKMTS